MSVTIAVDLTPVLPGGENGGAKPLALDVVRGLAALRPQWSFVLLTNWRAHDELAVLEAANIRRVCVVQQPQQSHSAPSSAPAEPLTTKARRWLEGRVAPLLPPKMIAAARSPYRRALRQFNQSPLLPQLGASLLLCPFTAPFYAHRSIPTVCVVLDLQFASYPQFFTREQLIERETHLMMACETASVLITISRYVQQTIVDFAHVAEDKIRVIGAVAQPAQVPRASRWGPLRDRLGLEEQRYFLFPANFWLHKNHEMLVTAFAMLSRAGQAQDWKLVFTGAPGERQDELRTMVERIGMSGSIVFAGFLSGEELQSVLRHSGALVFPSLYEGFGMPVIEAMRAGVPVLCSDRTALPEVAGGAALLFDPRNPFAIAEAMRQVIEELALREELRKKAFHRVDTLDASSSTAQAYLDVVESVLRERV